MKNFFIESYRIDRRREDWEYSVFSTKFFHPPIQTRIQTPAILRARFALFVDCTPEDLKYAVHQGVNDFLREFSEVHESITGEVFEDTIKCQEVVELQYECEGFDRDYSEYYRPQLHSPLVTVYRYDRLLIKGDLAACVNSYRERLNSLTI